MIRPPSLQQQYTLIFSRDPALELPADEETKATALRTARETGQWQPLIRAGEMPTLFQMRQIPGSTAAWFAGEGQRRRLVGLEACELVLRLALRGIENFGGVKLTYESRDGETLVTREIVDQLYGIDPLDPNVGRALVAELGGSVIARMNEGIGPKS